MQNVLTFWTDFFSILSDFLLAEPVCYFVAIIILYMIIGLLQKLIFSNNV